MNAKRIFESISFWFAGVSMGLAACNLIWIVSDNNKESIVIDKINQKIAGDMDVQSFSANRIIIDDASNTNIIRLTGNAKTKDGQSLNFAEANYKLTDTCFESLTNNLKNKNKLSDFDTLILSNIYEVLLQSEYLEGNLTNVSIKNSDEVVMRLSKPKIDEEQDIASYKISMLSLKDSKLTITDYVVSTKLDDSIKQHPEQVYVTSPDACTVNKIGHQTINDVNFAHVNGESTFTC